MVNCFIVPARGLSSGKSRLQELLGSDERRQLNLRLLRSVLGAVASLNAARDGFLLVSPDPELRTEAQRFGATFEQEAVAAGMNAAVGAGLARARERGYVCATVLPADLPLVAADDIRALVQAAGAGVAVAPDRRGEGTNGLVLRLDNPVELSFEKDSFRRHVAAAEERRLPIAIVRRSGLAFDLDLPADWLEWRSGITHGIAALPA
jgi:2-phospho-L-lactate guanylyltransferase